MPRYSPRILLLTICCCFAFGQANDSSTKKYVLASVKVTGSKRYSVADVVSSTGLALNQHVSIDDLQKASDAVGQSGAFSSVQYTYASIGMPKIEATFKVVDSPDYVPAIFQNIVWVPNAELIAAIHGRVPLFNGNLPMMGTLQEQVRAATAGFLKQRGMNAEITASPLGDIGKPLRAVAYSADGVTVRIADVNLAGCTLTSDPELKLITKSLMQTEFDQSFMRRIVELDLIDFYQSRGYLDVKFSEPTFTLTKDDRVAPEVAISIPITEGTQYRFAGATVEGASAVPPAEIGKLVPLQMGEIADLVKFKAALSKVRKLYGPLGLMEAATRIEPRRNPDGTVIFAVLVKEGVAYHMGKLELHGVSPDLTARLTRAWRLATGALYDDNYPKRFMGEVPPIVGMSQKVEYIYREVLHDDLKTVDVSLELRPR